MMIDINNHDCDEDDDGNDNNIENGDQWAATLLDRFKSKHLMCSSYARTWLFVSWHYI